MPLAALAGGLVGGSFLEVLGRKTTILMTSIPFMGAGLLVTYAQDVNMIYVGRAISGFCIGIVSLSLPVILIIWCNEFERWAIDYNSSLKNVYLV